MMHELATQLLSEQQPLPVASVFETVALSRATHYRIEAKTASSYLDIQLRDYIQRLALQWPCYGYRRITAQLHR